MQRRNVHYNVKRKRECEPHPKSLSQSQVHKHRTILHFSYWGDQIPCSRKTTDSCTNVYPKTMKPFQNQRKMATFSSGSQLRSHSKAAGRVFPDHGIRHSLCPTCFSSHLCECEDEPWGGNFWSRFSGSLGSCKHSSSFGKSLPEGRSSDWMQWTLEQGQGAVTWYSQ